MERLYKKITIVSSLICIAFLGLAAIEENFLREWKNYQSEFRNILQSKAQNSRQKEAARSFPIEIRQVILNDFKRVDRCVSCHNGVDNPDMADEAVPHKTHSGAHLKHHPVEKFGCTVCHGGQDRALNLKQAFTRTESVHWEEYPLIPLAYTQSACGKCHLSVSDKDQRLNGAETLIKGREVFYNQGCLGCHKVRGTGGSVGPELTDQGRKIRHAYSFEHVAGPHTVPNWLKEHFQNPQVVVPGSLMPKIELGEADLEALITFTMSLHSPDLPTQYYTLDYISEFKGGRKALTGEESYGRYCSYCHGDAAKGRDFSVIERFNPALNNEEFLSAASDDFIRYTIQQGRPDRLMPSWRLTNGGLSDEEIEKLVKFIRSHEPEPPSLAQVKSAKASKRIGRKLYRTRCSGCHGGKGEGGVGPALNNQDFLAIADYEFLYETIVQGRSNTAMVSHKWLKPHWIASIIAFMESWRKVPLVALSEEPIHGDIDNGKTLYTGLCSPCHGTQGEGAVGTALMNSDFLAAAKDQFIRESMVRGREHRAMLAWKKGGLSLAELSDKEIDDIVAFIRSYEDYQPTQVISNVVTGTLSKGKELYQGLCAGCHGRNGEGGVGTALNDQQFLRFATNGFIQAAIVRGRTNTPMRPWGRGTQALQELDTEQINDITVYIRSWQKPESESGGSESQIARK